MPGQILAPSLKRNQITWTEVSSPKTKRSDLERFSYVKDAPD